MTFEGKVVIITGSASGIGATTAHHFAIQSAKIVIVDINEENLQKVAKAVEEAKGIKPLVIKADVTKDDEVKNIVDKTIEQFGRIDVLLNNVGAGMPAYLKDGIEPFDRMIAVNLRCAYLLTSLAAPHLIKTKGNVINTTSVAGVRPSAGALPYCVSKAALNMFTKCVAKDLATHGVRVNSVSPGLVKTNFLNAMGLNDEQVNGLVKMRTEHVPLGYIATTDEVAELILFLASEKARSITGSIYFIDNGDLL